MDKLWYEQQHRLDDLTGLVHDVLEHWKDKGPDAQLTFEELAQRPLRESQEWQKRAERAREAKQQGQAAVANCNALERYTRANAILRHESQRCWACGADLTVPHEWVIGSHVSCYQVWNTSMLNSSESDR